MLRPRSAMRKIREVLRLTFGEGLNRRQVGAAVALPSTTVADYVARARRAGLGWPLPESLDDRQLEERLFVSAAPSPVTRPLPDWATVHRELRRPGVTLQLLHLEYKERASNGYQYSQFCRHYWRWQRHLDVVMRQEHRAGQKLFVDFAGQTVPVVDPKTGAITQVELFVAVLGASREEAAAAVKGAEEGLRAPPPQSGRSDAVEGRIEHLSELCGDGRRLSTGAAGELAALERTQEEAARSERRRQREAWARRARPAGGAEAHVEHARQAAQAARRVGR